MAKWNQKTIGGGVPKAQRASNPDERRRSGLRMPGFGQISHHNPVIITVRKVTEHKG